jgi:glycosyltransferase involved in cell wall biosynthesis
LKHIVIIGPAYPLRGGIAAYTQRLAKQFIDEGCKTTIYTFSLQYPSFFFPGKTQYSTDAPPDGLNIYRKINSINPLNWIKAGNEIKKLNADIVVFCYWIPFMAPCFGVMAGIIQRNNKSTVVGVIHNMLPHEKRNGDVLLSRYFVKSCHYFITMTEKVDYDLHQIKETAISILIPHPLYDGYGNAVSKTEAAAYLKLDPEKKYILFFGLIRKYKGLDILLHAMADSSIDVNLIIAGEFYEDRKYYDDLIQSLNIYNRVIIHSAFIPDSEVRYYFSVSDLVVLPYRNATQSGVGAIALYFDKPMIVSNFGGLPEMVDDKKSGYIVKDNAQSIADAIKDFYSADRSQMVEAVKAKKQKYSWAEITKAILHLDEVHK